MDCVILSVQDQSPMGNHLTQRHKLVNASQHPITVGDGVGVYGMWFDPGYGYHVDVTKGIAKGSRARAAAAGAGAGGAARADPPAQATNRSPSTRS